MQQNDEDFMKTRGILTAFLLLAPAGGAFAASKEIQELQRDVALMQEDIRTLQRSFDQQVAGLRTLTQQAVDNSNRTAFEDLSAGGAGRCGYAMAKVGGHGRCRVEGEPKKGDRPLAGFQLERIRML